MGYSPFKFLIGILGLWDTSQQTSQTLLECPAQLDILGSGLSKTGTQSLKYSLELLGYKVYNMESMMYNNHFEYLHDIQENRTNVSAVQEYHDAILDTGSTVVLDFPTNMFVHEFSEMSPDAQVIYTTREPQKWVESIEHTFNAFVPLIGSPYSWFFDLETLGKSFFGTFCNYKIQRWQPWFMPWVDIPYTFTIRDYQECRELFYWHQFKTLRYFQPKTYKGNTNKFLFYNIKEGWDPLLQFLNKTSNNANKLSDLPDFPQVNKRIDIDMITFLTRMIAYTYPVWIALSVSLSLQLCVLIGRLYIRLSRV